MAAKSIAVKNFIIQLAYRIWGTEIIIPEPPANLPLNSLSPVSDADSDGIFCNTLYWALKNRKEKEIRNIAITGPYGSGKSSLLKTFKEKYKHDSDLKFLNISLATFKEEKDPVNGKTSGEDLLRLIELSILQQLFYFEKDQAIPDSRFKRIKSFRKINIWTTAIAFSLFAFALCHQINPCLITKLILQKCVWPVPVWFHYSTLSIVVLFGFLFLLKSIRVLRSITLKSFKLNDTAEFEISESINKSILNHHLDEILYFFQVTNYTVVIIEDLDRFEQTEIFTKLRELNLLINNSRKIKRDIVFIYAVRDELFQGEKERTKFFDFLIPIIPVINSSNSGEKLLNIVEQSNYKISKGLVEDVALFIDDMRLLYNIMNEYYLYAQKLDAKLDQDKLFAMMVYKNLYPDDFVELGNNKGSLVLFFDERDRLLKQLSENVDTQIADKKAEIRRLEQLQIVDTDELRKLYLLQYISQLQSITHFELDGHSYSLNQIPEITSDEELFDYFIQDNVKYTRLQRPSEYHNYSSQTTDITLKFEDISDQVDSGATYYERLELITDFHNDKEELIRKEISNLERQKIQTKNQPLKELMQKQSVSVKLDNTKQQQLVNILLRNGHIDEHYHDYISIFYEGSITKKDREFLLNVKAQIATDFSYKLVKIDNLIGKINTAEFDQPHILNYLLIDYLFGTTAYQSQRKSILNLLSDESELSIGFVNGLIDVAVNKGKFIQLLSSQWTNYWKSISKHSVLTQERIRLFLSLLLEHGELTSISTIAKQSDLKTYLEGQEDFFRLIEDQKKLFDVTKELNLKFKQLDIQFTEPEEIEFIEQGNYYALNSEMIRSIVSTIGNYDEQTFDSQNYHALKESECDNLIEYVNSTINDYITKVYFKLPMNIDETEECLQELVNHADLNVKNKTSLLLFTRTKIAQLTSIPKLTDQTLLFTHSRIAAVWINLIHYYHNSEDVFNKELIEFLNNAENTFELVKTKIDGSEKAQPDLVTVKKFIIDLIKENQIQDDIYEQLLESIPWAYNRIPELETIDHEKMVLLIDKKTLNLTQENYNVIRENFSGSLHIKLARVHPSVLSKDPTMFEINSNDLYSLLSANEFSMNQKIIIANSINEELILSDTKLLKLYGEYILESSDFTHQTVIIKAILLGKILPSFKHIKVFNVKRAILSKSEVASFLSLLPEPYSEMGMLGKRPTIPDNPDNLNLTTYLKALGIIKDYTKTNRGIKISTYRKNKE
ncbi:hypothetical protein D3C87_32420 [compost metagenome]